MDGDQRARAVRDLAAAAREASRQVALARRLFDRLTEEDSEEMQPADVIAADSALLNASRALPELARVAGKLARLLDGPAPRLALRSTDEPGRLDIIARMPDADVPVGTATRTGSGDSEGWRLRLAYPGSGQPYGSIGLHYRASYEEVLEAVTRHMDEHGPWWKPETGGGHD